MALSILNIIPAYNEGYLLKYQCRHGNKNDIGVFVIDNMSDDLTYYTIACGGAQYCMLDTAGSFHLEKIWSRMESVIHEIKPDWFIYGSADMFYESEIGLRKSIELADEQGFTQMEFNLIQIENIGGITDKMISPFTQHYYAIKKRLTRTLVCKYDPSVKFVSDGIRRDGIFIKRNAGTVFEMRATKSPSDRFEIFMRRKMAWSEGLDENLGSHYRDQAEHNFIFDKNKDCEDIRNCKSEFELYKRLQSL